MKLDKSYNTYKGPLSKDIYLKVIVTIFRVIRHQMANGHKKELIPKLRIKYLGIFEPSLKKMKVFLNTNNEILNEEQKEKIRNRIKKRFN